MPRGKNNTEEDIQNQTTEEQQEVESKPEIKNENVEIIKDEDKIIVVRAKQGLSLAQFELLSKMLKAEEKNTGYKIILMPYSVDKVEVQ